MVALAVKGNRIYSMGYNYYPDRQCGGCLHEDYKGLSVHAELSALCQDDCVGTTLFIAGVRHHTGNVLENSKPCGRCSNLIRNSSVRRVVYFHDGVPVVKRVRDMEIQVIKKSNPRPHKPLIVMS